MQDLDDFTRQTLELAFKRKFFFVCEGTKTEVRYLNSLKLNSRKIGIKANVEIDVLLPKKEEVGRTSPTDVIARAKKNKTELQKNGKFDEEYDKMVAVIDLDVLRETGATVAYQQLLADSCGSISLAVTNPAFELFLILHHQDSIAKVIRPNAQLILENKKISSEERRPVAELLSKHYNINSKKRTQYGGIVISVRQAIQNEQSSIINKELDCALNCLTCNVGSIIEEMF